MYYQPYSQWIKHGISPRYNPNYTQVIPVNVICYINVRTLANVHKKTLKRGLNFFVVNELCKYTALKKIVDFQAKTKQLCS